MPTRRTARTSPQAARPLRTEPVAEAEEPMRIWPHPICRDLPQPCPTACPAPCCDLAPVLEQLQCQSQLLVDLLGAVNALTAAVLCREAKS